MSASPSWSGPRPRIEVRRRDPAQVAAEARGADVVAFSLYTWNQRYSLEVARRVRESSPGTRVVVGGPSVPRAPARTAAFLAEHGFVDALVLGEGEVTFPALLAAWARGAEPEPVAGLAYRDQAGGLRHTGPRARLQSFEAVASPFLDGTFDALLDRDGPRYSAAIWETNRGCPFACTFCDWGQATQSRVHELPLARLEAELDWMAERAFDFVYLIDANFGIRPRDADIARALAARRQRTGHPAHCYFHLTKNARERHLETVEVVRAAGIATQVALSTQDFDPVVLAAVQRENISPERSRRLRAVCNERAIPTFNELILGLPEQTLGSFCDSMVQALSPHPGDSFFLYLCRLLENAELASAPHRERYGLETVWCVAGDAHRVAKEAWVVEREEVVVATRALPPGDWERAYRFGQLLSAFSNLRLANLLVEAIHWRSEASLRGWIEHVLAAMAEAPADTVLARLERVLRSYVEALRGEGRLLLPREDTGPHEWAVGDALLLAALAAPAGFFAELAAETEAWARAAGLPSAERQRLAECVAVQALVTPTPGQAAPRSLAVRWDWPALMAAPAGLAESVWGERRGQLRFVPPDYAEAASLYAFAVRHLGAVYGKQERGRVEWLADDSEPSAS